MKHSILKLSLAVLLSLLSVAQVLSENREYILRKYLNEPARNAKSYDFKPSRPLISRVQKAPKFLIKYLKQIDRVSNYETYMPSKRELQYIEFTLNQLPESFRTAMKQRLVGIFFIKNFKGGGMTDCIFGEGKEKLYFIIINEQALRTTADKWLTYKDNSCFIQDDPSIQIVVDCGQGLPEFVEILTHETAHLADYVIGFTPFVEEYLKEIDGERPDKTQFTKDIWRDYFVPEKNYDFPMRDKLFFYGLMPPALRKIQAVQLYRDLSKTPFVSLYGSRNWVDDFACLFSYYYITRVLKRPYEYQIVKNGVTVFTWSPDNSALVTCRLPFIKNIFDGH